MSDDGAGPAGGPRRRPELSPRWRLRPRWPSPTCSPPPVPADDPRRDPDGKARRVPSEAPGSRRRRRPPRPCACGWTVLLWTGGFGVCAPSGPPGPRWPPVAPQGASLSPCRQPRSPPRRRRRWPGPWRCRRRPPRQGPLGGPGPQPGACRPEPRWPGLWPPAAEENEPRAASCAARRRMPCECRSTGRFSAPSAGCRLAWLRWR